MLMFKRGIFTSESVSEGHPDKVADQISDSVLDALLKEDPYSRVGCETLAANGFIVVTGEITTKAKEFDYTDIVRKTVREIGYTDSSFGIDADSCGVLIGVNKQSPDIAMGVDKDGAGDQGMMFGFATQETPELMPLPILMAHKLTYRMAEARKKGETTFLRPDSKSQVSVRYEDDKPVAIDTVVISTQHAAEVDLKTLKEYVIEEIIKKTIPANLLSKNTTFHINPTGRFVIGGPMGDAGLTGRKIIVDTYGGIGRHGGGAFSGKDSTKVDRSAAYMARYIAKNIVAAGIATTCEIQLAYAIGVAEPVSVFAETYGTSKVNHEKIEEMIRKIFPLTPKGIIEHLQLRRPIFAKTAAYGHFGRELPEFTWEKKDMVEKIKASL
ncbi:MAG: methionine adenosyltransferase [Spirochaetes bacterium GWB1_36_13]|nr:MAG: methionine adenosyltransferase [Spirochaetes bacterium GWB1_36_13]